MDGPVFISGVAGFLGSHLARRFLDAGRSVCGIDNLLGGEKENVPDGVDFRAADCRDTDAYLDLLSGSDLVYHCAAAAYDGLSAFTPAFVHEHTCTTTVSLMAASIRANIRRFVFCSSMSRYGHGAPPFTEDLQPRPVSPYGIAKYASELTVRSLCETHGVEFNIAVPHNVIGPGQRYNDPYRNVAGILINRMLRGERPLIFGDGTQKRCFSYVSDVVTCLERLGTLAGVTSEVVNVGPDEEEITILDLVSILAEILGVRCEPIFLPVRPGEVHYATCSSEKARRLLGYRTETRLRDGLERMVTWVADRGSRDFDYQVPLEIVNDLTPGAWIGKYHSVHAGSSSILSANDMATVR